MFLIHWNVKPLTEVRFCQVLPLSFPFLWLASLYPGPLRQWDGLYAASAPAVMTSVSCRSLLTGWNLEHGVFTCVLTSHTVFFLFVLFLFLFFYFWCEICISCLLHISQYLLYFYRIYMPYRFFRKAQAFHLTV